PPPLGAFISSIRPSADILQPGWWNVIPHQEWTQGEKLQLSKDTDLRQPIEVNGQTYTDDQLKAGVKVDDSRLMWENRRARTINVQEQGWKTIPDFTMDNYNNVLSGKEYKLTEADGSETVQKGTGLSQAFWNTLTIAVPATVIPVLIASFAAYAFAWLRFPGRKTLFVIIIAMLVIPIQVALI
ncbi:sugar ABC transporter permease, partial [Paenibacillus riograndensis]